MTIYVQVAVNVPRIADVYDYHLPPEMENQVDVGTLVEVPFGRQHVQGVVMGFVVEPSVSKTRPVMEVIDSRAVVTPAQLSLARYLADSTLASLSECLFMMIPSGLSVRSDSLYRLHRIPVGEELTRTQTRLVKMLQERGALRGRQIGYAMPRTNWRASIRSLVRRGLVSAEAVLPEPNVGPKIVRTVQLTADPESAQEQMPRLSRQGTKALPRRQTILRYLLRHPGPLNVSQVYAESGGNLDDLRRLSEMGLVSLGERQEWRDPMEEIEVQEVFPIAPPTLTQDQRVCWEGIQKGVRRAAAGSHTPPILLHGVTGSGKTEIYLRAVAETLELGRQAIVMVPEIALTPQTIRRFYTRFAGRVGLIHSRLSEGERYDTWRRARAGEFDVVVGPRSALFTPFSNIGLIVLDESHDESYYQSEPPFYHARQAAVAYARLAGAACVMGSATPDVTSTYRAAQGDWQYHKLPARILAHRQVVESQAKRLGLESRYRHLEEQAETMDLPPVSVVDMRQELKSGNRSIFSRELQDGIERVLDQDQQAILFLNRRGTATYVFCRDCGYTLKCPRCDLPLTYHGREKALMCHHCGYQRGMPRKCPQCGGRRIRQYGTGTERVEAEINALYPTARTLRWDYETTRQKGAHDRILSRFISHQSDILIGTQMLAKGLDLPLVTLVGVILADVGLNLPDYRAAERTFQVLTQVAGRAGRSPLGGEVILQTFEPQHYVIQAASEHNYRAFYLKELEYRRQLVYPPFSQLVRLEYRDTDHDRAESLVRRMADQVKGWIEAERRAATEIIGPAPCFFARLGGLYRWQIILRGPDPVSLLRGRSLDDWRVEVDPPSLL
jgi:primosomal protein N' (replication factor Y)